MKAHFHPKDSQACQIINIWAIAPPTF